MDALTESNAQPPSADPPVRKKRGLGGAIAAGAALVLSKLKFLLIFLKTGGSMLLMMWLYAKAWGWAFAAGFVLLILVHECGHLLVARRFGLKVGAPVFIPFMGAFIALKEAPRDAWMEACVGIGGPLLGTLGAAACVGIYAATGQPMYLALAYSGFFLNLFNLIPITPLDGGRIAAAISPWLWGVGIAILGVLLYLHFNFLLLLIAILCAARLIRLTRTHREAIASYFTVSPRRRWTLCAVYFALMAGLAIGMIFTRVEFGAS